MPSLSSWLSDVSRRKLRIAALGRDGLRDTINLHRFVLLKNSITQAEVEPIPSSEPSPLVADDDSSDHLVYSAAVTSLEPHSNVSSPDSEEKWLESVLETLDDDFDHEIEVNVHPVEEDDDLEFSDLSSHPLYDSWSRHDIDPPMSMSIASSFLASASIPPPQPLSPSTVLQLPFNPIDSPFSKPFVEPRYPEADYDLPTSDSSSDSDSDDEGPLTPYSGSQPSIDERGVGEPEVYVEHDSYFLYPSELDPISPPPIYFQQC